MSWLRLLDRLLRFRRARGSATTPRASQATAEETPHSTPPTTTPPRTSERAQPATFVIVGLDFGTSGTKVVVRLLDKGRPASAVDFGTSQTGFSRFSFPSTIAVENARFLFGAEAERQQEGPVFRSLKRALMDTNGEVGPAKSPAVPPRPRDLHAHPHFLVAVYLGAVLRQVRDLVGQELGVVAEFLYNLDIPVSQLDDGPIQRGFQTALDAAVDFAESDDLRLDDLHGVWERWLSVLRRENTGVADREHKRWELIPESSCIVKGAEEALASILPDSRRYTAIVDIGAGTTDVGWFRWVTPVEGDRIYFFSAKTCLVGCDEVDNTLLDTLAVSDDERPRLFPLIRAAKPKLDADRRVDVGEEYGPLTAGDLAQAVRAVSERCFEQYRVSFGEAYPKDRNTNHWRNIRVILVGGGSQLRGFRARFNRHPMRFYGRDVELRLPGKAASVGLAAATLGALGASSVPPSDDDIVFLLPALGLSYPAVEIPEPGLPDDIPPSPSPSQEPTGPYDYDPDDG